MFDMLDTLTGDGKVTDLQMGLDIEVDLLLRDPTQRREATETRRGPRRPRKRSIGKSIAGTGTDSLATQLPFVENFGISSSCAH